MRKAVFTLLVSGFWLAACAPQQRTIHLSSTFDRSEAEFILTDGTATIAGQAFLRQRGGGVVTCAGSIVHLVPMTDYSDERIQSIYGSGLGGGSYELFPKFVPDSSVYITLSRTAQCDAGGEFEFSNVPAGNFYVATTVRRVVGNAQQGGSIARPVVVARGQRVTVLLTQ